MKEWSSEGKYGKDGEVLINGYMVIRGANIREPLVCLSYFSKSLWKTLKLLLPSKCKKLEWNTIFCCKWCV